MITTSSIASSVALPVSAVVSSSASHAPSASDIHNLATNLLNSGAIPTSATGVTAGKADSGVGSSPRFIAPLPVHDDSTDSTADQPALARALGGYTLQGRAFSSMLYASQVFAQAYAETQAQTAASNTAVSIATAEAASESYTRTASLTAPSTISEDVPVTGEPANTGETTTPTPLPLTTSLPLLSDQRISLPAGNDNTTRPKLVVDRGSVRNTGTTAYLAVQNRNDSQLTINLPISASA